MTIAETIRDVTFVIGPDGQPTAALVEIAVWQHIVDLLEEAEDQNLLHLYLTRRRVAHAPTELGLITWEEAENELDAREERGDAALG